MTQPSPDGQPPVAAAIETLVAELEREHGWLADLRKDAERAERSCQRLLTAVEAALDTLPMRARQPFYARVMRMRNETRPLGRPARDPRRRIVLDYLAERGDGTVTNAELRARIARHGLDGPPAYVGRLLATLAEAGIVERTGMGRYRVNGSHERLRMLRWRNAALAETEALKAESERVRAALEGREA